MIAIPGVIPLDVLVREDHRGTFRKVTSSEWGTWKECFYTDSLKGVLRGMHYQRGQSKVVCCMSGTIVDAVIDVRRDSERYGEHEIRTMSAGDAIYVSPGIAHGFYATEDARVLYLTSSVHDIRTDGGVRWDTCGIPWPLDGQPIISDRDLALPAFKSCARS